MSLNTTLPNILDIIHHIHTKLAMISIPKTKLIATKSTRYIQNIFSQYKFIFNSTHALTKCIQQRIPYTLSRGGLLRLIHTKYAYPNNITKIPTPTNISPYLQIIHIKNCPLQSWLILHLYMPTHNEDVGLITTIQQTIKTQIIAHPNHTYLLCSDFNRDIALIRRQNEHGNTPPNKEDLMSRTYTQNIALTYIPTNTNFST